MQLLADAISALATAIASLGTAMDGKVITEQSVVDGLVLQVNAAKTAVDGMIADLA